jgi:copper chaperone CopZ
MTILKVPDMHCEKCVERITKALNAENLQFKVSLQEKTVAVEGGEPQVKAAVIALDDLGFEAQP